MNDQSNRLTLADEEALESAMDERTDCLESNQRIVDLRFPHPRGGGYSFSAHVLPEEGVTLAMGMLQDQARRHPVTALYLTFGSRESARKVLNEWIAALDRSQKPEAS